MAQWWKKKTRLPVQELQQTRAQSLGREDPLGVEMAPRSGILARESCGQRRLWATVRGAAESDAAAQLSTHAAYDVSVCTHWGRWPRIPFLVMSLAGLCQPHKVGWRYCPLLCFL